MNKIPNVNVQIYTPADKVMALDEELELIQKERGMAKAPSRSQIINEAIDAFLKSRKEGRGA